MIPTPVCEWEHNPEFPRWETECDDLIVLFEFADPRPYGFKWCPFCGRLIAWKENSDE